MSSVKRAMKRPMAGMRVSALFPDGIYHPCIVHGIKRRPATGEIFYEVFGEDMVVRDLPPADIVGPTGQTGFSQVSSTHLKFNQPVFVTVNGREIKAIVQKHRKQTNEVLLKSADATETIFQRKLDDVRLIESRKTARAFDHGIDYQKLVTEMNAETKKRPVSTSIEVPSAKSLKIHESEPPMDHVTAAMVLTSLGSSPLVHRERNPSGDSVLSIGPMSPASSLSSGYGNVSPSPSPSTNLHFNWDLSRSTPSPASSSSDTESAVPPQPFTSGGGSLPTPTALFSSSIDEGIDVSSGSPPFAIDDAATPCSPSKKFKQSVKTSYKCTWQRCGKTLSTVQGIERHIRTIHLKKRDGEEYSDHEEEFYYTEIDTTVESVSDTLANMCTSSSPPASTAAFTFDHALLHQNLAQNEKSHTPSQQEHPHPLRDLDHHNNQEQAHSNQQQQQQQQSATHPHKQQQMDSYHKQQELESREGSVAMEISCSLPASSSSSMSSSPLSSSSRVPLKARPRGRNLSGPCEIRTSSSSSSSSSPQDQDQDQQPILASSVPNQSLTLMATPMSIPSSAQFTWCSVSTGTSSFNFPSSSSSASSSSSLPSQASHGRMRHKSAPHSSHGQPKIRSEGKKCRKVYGMENKDLWCTQCRWKKACVRFT